MAAVPVTISGVLVDKLGRTIQQVSLYGEMSRSDVGVGGGPITPPEGGGEGPPQIWPSPGHPTQPIYIPDEIWPNPPEGQAPMPMPPIYIPPPPGTDAPRLEAKVVWTAEDGWQVVLVPAEGSGPHPTPSGRRR